jgi:multicomponent Na+:H+ antiporter subunit C
MVYALCFVLIAIGIYGAVVKKNIVKIVMGLAFMEYGVNLLLILIGYRQGGIVPILGEQAGAVDLVGKAVDPVMHAVVLSAIVINLSMLLILVAICIRLYERYGTFDITEIRRLKG